MAAMWRREEDKFGPRPAFLRYTLASLPHPTFEGSILKNRTKFNPCGMEPTRTFTRLRAGEFSFSQDKERPGPMNSLSLSTASVLSSEEIICQQVGRCS